MRWIDAAMLNLKSVAEIDMRTITLRLNRTYACLTLKNNNMQFVTLNMWEGSGNG